MCSPGHKEKVLSVWFLKEEEEKKKESLSGIFTKHRHQRKCLVIGEFFIDLLEENDLRTKKLVADVKDLNYHYQSLVTSSE